MITTQTINAAILNISGRQRMLSQRIALFCLRLVSTTDAIARAKIRQELEELVALMARSHQGLIEGDAALNLPGEPSAIVREMYFASPLQVDHQVKIFLAEVQALLALPDESLNLEQEHLQFILESATQTLLPALDAIVNQYQQESDAEQQAIFARQIELSQQNQEAATAALDKSEQLQQTLDSLHQAQSQLIQAEKMSTLGHLLAGVAHEINNPVNFIAGNLSHADGYIQDLLGLIELYQKHYPQPSTEIEQQIEALDLEFLQEDLVKLINSMKMGTDRICKIVLSLRNFSRTDELNCKAVDLHEGIDNTLMILQYRLKAKSDHSEIKVIREYGRLPSVECYPGQLNQVFMNILANAIDALEEAEVKESRITIVTQQVDPQSVTITISDNGPGITEQVKKRIFEPFFTTKPVGKGTGMGMSISRQIIIEKHHGTLDCYSTPGEGTQFVIRLPIRQPD